MQPSIHSNQVDPIRSAVLLAGMRGTGKTCAGEKLQGFGEIIDAELLQYQAAAAIEPNTTDEERYAWEFWTEDRLRKLPDALNNAFVNTYGSAPKAHKNIVLVAAVLVKDWFLTPLKNVLAHHRSGLTWPKENFLVLDFAPAEIHHRIQKRDRIHERTITLDQVEKESVGYRDDHVKKSDYPWRLLAEPAALQTELHRLCVLAPISPR